MKHYIKYSKELFLQFAKEKSGNLLLEFTVLIAVFAVSAALISPVVKDKLADMYENQSRDITFGGERGDVVITETPQTNSLPAVDTSTSTNTVKKYLFKFDGQTYIQLPDTLMNFGSGSSNVTVEGWYYIDASSNVSLFGKNGSLPNENQFMFGIYNNNFDIASSNTTYRSTYYPIRYQKVHLAMAINGNVATVYENGVNKWQVTINPRTLSSERAPKLGMDLDAGINTPSDFFKGYMYEIRLYNKELTQSEVIDNMNGKSLRTNLVSEYLFNDGPGNIISDHSGNGNNANVVGTPIWEIQ